MRRSSNISAFQKTLFFVLGLMVAVFVVSQEVLDYHCAKLSSQLEHDEPAEESSPEAQLAMLTCDVVLPASSLSLEPFTPVFIRELTLEKGQIQPQTEDIALDNTPFFKTLFRQIISPNAP